MLRERAMGFYCACNIKFGDVRRWTSLLDEGPKIAFCYLASASRGKVVPLYSGESPSGPYRG